MENVLTLNLPETPVRSPGRNATALKLLMQAWEQDAVAEEEENESELMVMLSGMVGSHAMLTGDE